MMAGGTEMTWNRSTDDETAIAIVHDDSSEDQNNVRVVTMP